MAQPFGHCLASPIAAMVVKASPFDALAMAHGAWLRRETPMRWQAGWGSLMGSVLNHSHALERCAMADGVVLRTLFCAMCHLPRGTNQALRARCQMADAMIDTTSPHGKLIIAVLGALAEFERSMILARTADGRRRAQERGVGRKPKLTDYQRKEALARRQSGECLADIGRSFGVSHSTISRL